MYQHDFISGEMKPRPLNLTNASTRMMTAYHDSVNNPHFSKSFATKLSQFPSVFRRTNGEFSAYSSAYSAHKIVLCKNFSPA